MGLNSRITTRIMKQFLIVPALLCSSSAQLKFGGSQSSSGSKGGQKASNEKPNTDTRFFTGNEALDGGILGLGAGLLGGAVLGGVLNGGNGGNGCGRRRRQADGTNTKFLGALLGGGSGGCNCGRRKRQAPGEDKPGTRFFGLDGLLGGGSNNNCCNCGYNSGYNNGYNNGFNNGVNNGGNNGFNSDSTTHNHQTDANVTTTSHFKTSMVTLMVPVGELMKLVADGVTLLAMAALMQDNLRGFQTTLGHTKPVQHRVRDKISINTF